MQGGVGQDVSLWSAAGNREEPQHPDPKPSSLIQKHSVVPGPPANSKDLLSLSPGGNYGRMIKI